MPFNWGLLSEQSLANQPAEIRQGLQEQATKQFLLGTFLGGSLGAGYRAAQAVPEQYQTRVEQQALDRMIAQAKQNAVMPVMAEAAGPVMPGEQPPQMMVGQQFDVGQYARQLPSILAQAGPRAKLGNLEKVFQTTLQAAPQISEGILRDPTTGRLLGFAPKIDLKEGIAFTGERMQAVPGAREARIATAIPIAGQNIEQYIEDGVIKSRPVAGATQAVMQLQAAQTAGTQLGTPREVTVPGVGTTLQFPNIQVPQNILGGPSVPATPRPTRQVAPAAGMAPAGGMVLRPDEAITAAAKERFTKFSEQALNSALSAGTRKQSAEYLYNAAEQLDPNVATPFFASAASYLRAIPGVGDQFDSFAGNYNLMNKSRAQGILNGFANVKGNANPQEVRIVENAASNPTQDPKWNTKWISALEIATADKDEARNRFVEAYQGDPRQVNTAWAGSPENTRVYNHPMVERFLREQIASNPQNPVLPAGFELVQSKKSGQYFIQKPDGSRIPVAQ